MTEKRQDEPLLPLQRSFTRKPPAAAAAAADAHLSVFFGRPSRIDPARSPCVALQARIGSQPQLHSMPYGWKEERRRRKSFLPEIGSKDSKPKQENNGWDL